jgi:hypothetical protein
VWLQSSRGTLNDAEPAGTTGQLEDIGGMDKCENIPLVLRVPHHGLSESVASRIIPLGKQHELATEMTPEKDTLKWRKRFMEENPCLTSEQVAEEATSQATDRAASASRWAKERKVFSVRFEGAQWFPRFQFQDGRPIPVVADVMQIFPEQASAWEQAYFFVTPNMTISGRKPKGFGHQGKIKLLQQSGIEIQEQDVDTRRPRSPRGAGGSAFFLDIPTWRSNMARSTYFDLGRSADACPGSAGSESG